MAKPMYEPSKRRKLTKVERQTVYDKCGGHCAYCGVGITLGQMQVDHVQPISINGEDDLCNMLPACRSCNNYKHSMPLYMFRRAVEAWPEVLKRDSVTYRNAVRFGLVVPRPHHVVFYFEQRADGAANCEIAEYVENCAECGFCEAEKAGEGKPEMEDKANV